MFIGNHTYRERREKRVTNTSHTSPSILQTVVLLFLHSAQRATSISLTCDAETLAAQLTDLVLREMASVSVGNHSRNDTLDNALQKRPQPQKEGKHRHRLGISRWYGNDNSGGLVGWDGRSVWGVVARRQTRKNQQATTL